jgi:hypothetical protein
MATLFKRIFNPDPDQTFSAIFTIVLLGLIILGGVFVGWQDAAPWRITLLLAAACLSLGALVGFLFGIPKILQGTPSSGSTSQYMPNTSLEEISDWLTKIIVGLGLVELKNIPSNIQQTAEYIAGKIASSQSEVGDAISLISSILIYFPIVGFIGSYLITRMYLANEIRNADAKLGEPTDAMKDVVRNIQEAISKIQAKLIAVPPVGTDTSLTETPPPSVKGSENDDPQKGQWGSLDERNSRKLSAEVSPLQGSEGLYTVLLTVQSTDPVNKPLEGAVKFFLHPSFFNSTPIIFAKDNKAQVTLTAWGAFTVGAQADEGDTQLELDLADAKWGFPSDFINR